MKTNLIWVFLLSFFISLMSCEKNDSSPASDPAASEEDLSDFTLLAALSASNARMPDSTLTAGSNKHCNLTELDPEELPESVSNYVTSTYESATVERAGKTSEGAFIVHISKADGTHAALLFDADGNFVSEKTHEGKHGTPLETADLPEAVTTYINSQYSGVTIEKAMQDNEGNYMVAIKKSDGTFAGLAFDAEGNFTSELTLKGGFGRKGHHGRH